MSEHLRRDPVDPAAKLSEAVRPLSENADDQRRPPIADAIQRRAPVGAIAVKVHRVIGDGDLVAVHSYYKTWNMAGVEIFRFNEDSKIIEHWDVLQPVPDTTASGNDMFSQLS